MKALIEFLLSLFVSKEGKKEQSVDTTLLDARDESQDPVFLPIAFKNDQARLKDEYGELITHNAYLYNLLTTLNEYTNKQFGKNIVITMIYRTAAEQDYLYRNSAKYAKKKFKSPHQFWHGIDLRSRTFNKAEIKQIVAWLNANNDQENYYKWTAKCHNAGSGMHFHIQFSR